MDICHFLSSSLLGLQYFYLCQIQQSMQQRAIVYFLTTVKAHYSITSDIASLKVQIPRPRVKKPPKSEEAKNNITVGT